jgi:hypothetical protein
MTYPNYYPPVGNMYIRRAREDGEYQDFGGAKGQNKSMYSSFGPQMMYNPYMGAAPMGFPPAGYPQQYYSNVGVGENNDEYNSGDNNQPEHMATHNQFNTNTTSSGRYTQKNFVANNKFEGSPQGGSSGKKFNDSGLKKTPTTGGNPAENVNALNNNNYDQSYSSNRRGNFFFEGKSKFQSKKKNNFFIRPRQRWKKRWPGSGCF